MGQLKHDNQDFIIANSCEMLFEQEQMDGLNEIYPPRSRQQIYDDLNARAQDEFLKLIGLDYDTKEFCEQEERWLAAENRARPYRQIIESERTPILAARVVSQMASEPDHAMRDTLSRLLGVIRTGTGSQQRQA